jgi:hypothetical protein
MTIQEEKAEIRRLDKEIEQEQQRHAAALQAYELGPRPKGKVKLETEGDHRLP